MSDLSFASVEPVTEFLFFVNYALIFHPATVIPPCLSLCSKLFAKSE